jgi:cold-inducible RNA-binding protein
MIVNGGSANERLVLELTRNPNFGNTLRNDRSRKKTHMNSKLYIGNLSFNTTEDAIRQAFGAHGDITDIYVAMDRETGRPRGFAFVTFSKAEEAQAAIEALNGSDLDGRSLKVNEAKPRE